MRTGSTPRHPSQPRHARRALGAAAVATLVGGTLAAATGPAGAARTAVEPVATPIPLTSVPSDGATNIRTEVPVSVTAQSGEKLAAVVLAGPDGVAVPGSLNPDGTAWTADAHLKTHTRYTLTATGVAADGSQVSRTSAFTTFAPAADKQLKFAATEPRDGDLVGVGMPILVQFTHPVTDRAAVEKALRVVTQPPQAGHWSWLSDARVDWRPESYWQPGTKVQVSLELDGVPAGDGKYGGGDTSFAFSVGRKQMSLVDLSKHRMTVYQNDKQVNEFPVTGGKPGADTWGGTMAVIDKASSVHMQSSTVGFGHEYDIPDVRWAIHLTYSGTYIHAAPWSVGSQGYANVSHGCVGLSMDRAAWLFQNTLPGDLVQVVNSPKNVAPGNGYGDWQESWNQWLGGSAVKS
ncbi:MAG: L,D-transpeptidase [Catenulispora sp.]|nr:L,D-transpeptidase [Catenulispora sp.]